MASLFDHLPVEIIILICENLASTSSKSLLHFSLASKGLYEIAYAIIYHDVRLISQWGPKSPLLRFTSGIVRHRQDVQSLEIGFSKGHMSAFLTGIPSAYTNLQPTAGLLPKLTNLKTFILNLAVHEKRNAMLPDSALALLLRNLPQNVRDLEIDTEGVDKVNYTEQQRWPAECYCEAIATLLPQLHHLRLRKGYLCSKVFNTLQVTSSHEQDGEAVPQYPLRSLTIRLDMESKWLESPEKTCYCEDRDAATAASGLSKPVREGIDQGILPHLQRAIIISRFGERDSLITARRTTHSGFAIHDIVRDRTTLIPMMAVEVDFDASIGRGHDALNKHGDMFLVRDLEGLDRFSTYEFLSHLVEGHTRFRDLIKTTSWPYELDLTQLDLRGQVTLPKTIRMSLWARESKTGQCLLNAKEVEGLVTTSTGMAEELPSGWKYAGSNKKGERMIERVNED